MRIINVLIDMYNKNILLPTDEEKSLMEHYKEKIRQGEKYPTHK